MSLEDLKAVRARLVTHLETEFHGKLIRHGNSKAGVELGECITGTGFNQQTVIPGCAFKHLPDIIQQEPENGFITRITGYTLLQFPVTSTDFTFEFMFFRLHQLTTITSGQ